MGYGAKTREDLIGTAQLVSALLRLQATDNDALKRKRGGSIQKAYVLSAMRVVDIRSKREDRTDIGKKAKVQAKLLSGGGKTFARRWRLYFPSAHIAFALVHHALAYFATSSRSVEELTPKAIKRHLASEIEGIIQLAMAIGNRLDAVVEAPGRGSETNFRWVFPDHLKADSEAWDLAQMNPVEDALLERLFKESGQHWYFQAGKEKMPEKG